MADRIVLDDPRFKPASGRTLTSWGMMFGFKRRWWGLEPDFLFKRRFRTFLTARNIRAGHESL